MMFDLFTKNHPSPKVRKARRWVEGVLIVILLLAAVFVLVCRGQIMSWML